MALDNMGWATSMLGLTFATTIITAWLSYNLFEKKIIRFVNQRITY